MGAGNFWFVGFRRVQARAGRSVGGRGGVWGGRVGLVPGIFTV